jgi:hypothetical protein
MWYTGWKGQQPAIHRWLQNMAEALFAIMAHLHRCCEYCVLRVTGARLGRSRGPYRNPLVVDMTADIVREILAEAS